MRDEDDEEDNKEDHDNEREHETKTTRGARAAVGGGRGVAVALNNEGVFRGRDAVDLVFGDLNDVGAGGEKKISWRRRRRRRRDPLRHGEMGSGGVRGRIEGNGGVVVCGMHGDRRVGDCVGLGNEWWFFQTASVFHAMYPFFYNSFCLILDFICFY